MAGKRIASVGVHYFHGVSGARVLFVASRNGEEEVGQAHQVRYRYLLCHLHGVACCNNIHRITHY